MGMQLSDKKVKQAAPAVPMPALPGFLKVVEIIWKR